jgi:hypothetical protein
MALSSPLNSFHVVSLFFVFYRQATTSNFKRVCSLKRVLYLTNLAFAITNLEALRFHSATWPYNSSMTILLNKSICACRLAMVSYDNCNHYCRTYSLWSYFTPWISCCCLKVKVSLLSLLSLSRISPYLPPPSSYVFSRWLFCSSPWTLFRFAHPLPPKGCYCPPSTCPLGPTITLLPIFSTSIW